MPVSIPRSRTVWCTELRAYLSGPGYPASRGRSFLAKLPDGITCGFTKTLVPAFDKSYVFEVLPLFLSATFSRSLSDENRARRESHEDTGKGISGEVHGNLEADLAVLTPAFSSCSFYGRALPG